MAREDNPGDLTEDDDDLDCEMDVDAPSGLDPAVSPRQSPPRAVPPASEGPQGDLG